MKVGLVFDATDMKPQRQTNHALKCTRRGRLVIDAWRLIGNAIGDGVFRTLPGAFWGSTHGEGRARRRWRLQALREGDLVIDAYDTATKRQHTFMV